MKMSKMRTVSNEEFLEVINNPDNANVIKSIKRKWRNIDEHELQSAINLGLLKAIAKYDENKISKKSGTKTKLKFTTSLYTIINWELINLFNKSKRVEREKDFRPNSYYYHNFDESVFVNFLDSEEKVIYDLLTSEKLTLKDICLKTGKNKKKIKQIISSIEHKCSSKV